MVLPRRVFLAGIGRDPHVLCYGIQGSAHPYKPGSGTFTDTAIVLCGQLFLAIVMMFCYCGLKDEIRNRDYYDQTEDRENDDLE